MTLSWVGVSGLVQELMELELVSEERTRFIEQLASDNDDSLSIQELLDEL
jgi:hypothetical protein